MSDTEFFQGKVKCLGGQNIHQEKNQSFPGIKVTEKTNFLPQMKSLLLQIEYVHGQHVDRLLLIHW